MTLPPMSPPPPPRHDSVVPSLASESTHAPEISLGKPLYPPLPTQLYPPLPKPFYPPLPMQDQARSTIRPKLRLNTESCRRMPAPPVGSRPGTPETSRYELVSPESIDLPPWMVYESLPEAAASEDHVTIDGDPRLERFPSVSQYPFQPQGLPNGDSMAEIEARTRDRDHDPTSDDYEIEDYEDQDAPFHSQSIEMGLDVDLNLFDALQDSLRLPLSSARARSATPPPRPVVMLNKSVEAELKDAVRTILDPSKREKHSAAEMRA